MGVRLPVLGLAAVVAVCLACGGALAGAGTDDGQAASSEPTIELVDAGNEPRTPLRYALVAGTSFAATQTVDQTIEQIDGDGVRTTTQVPTIILGLQTDVAEVLPDGTFRTTFAFTSVDTKGDGTARSADQALAIELQLNDIVGSSGETTATARGVVLDAGYDIPGSLPAAIKTVLEQFETQLQSVSPPLPEEPVGAGARWRVTTQLELAGVEAEQRYDFTLESVAGTGIDLTVELRQTARPQRFDPPGARSGDRYRLVALRARGSGSMSLDLATPVPLDADVTARSVQKTRVRQSGEDPQVITAKIDQEQQVKTT